MDESKLLEESVSVNLTPLQTILTSKTLLVITSLIEFLHQNKAIAMAKVAADDSIMPEFEQTGDILIDSALAALSEVNDKLWESGREAVGEHIPEEFEDVVELYYTALKQIAYQFIELLRESGN